MISACWLVIWWLPFRFSLAASQEARWQFRGKPRLISIRRKMQPRKRRARLAQAMCLSAIAILKIRACSRSNLPKGLLRRIFLMVRLRHGGSVIAGRKPRAFPTIRSILFRILLTRSPQHWDRILLPGFPRWHLAADHKVRHSPILPSNRLARR